MTGVCGQIQCMNSNTRTKLQQQHLNTVVTFCRAIQFSYKLSHSHPQFCGYTWACVCLCFETILQVPCSFKQLSTYLKPPPYAKGIYNEFKTCFLSPIEVNECALLRIQSNVHFHVCKLRAVHLCQ